MSPETPAAASAGAGGRGAQTITLSPESLEREIAGRLNRRLDGFTVYRSATLVGLRHEPCGQYWRYTGQAQPPLLRLVQSALGHDCPGAPE